MFRKTTLILTAIYLGFAIGGLAIAQTRGLKAAAGSLDITPSRTAFMAGYGMNRRSLNAHDRLSARCLVLESGGTRIAFVSCDVIGMPRYQITKIRAAVHSITPENLFVAATHTHSGPDTLGMWGPDLQTSGVDKEWISGVVAKIAALVDQTAASVKPSLLKIANTLDSPHISKNIRVPRILDTEMGVLQLVDASTKKPISTLVNFSCHPEILNNNHLTADFPHWLYQTVESGGGGVCLYLNGAQGGMITADYDEASAPKGENWQAAERIGTELGKKALEIIAPVETTDAPSIRTSRRVFTVPLENMRFAALVKLGVFPNELMSAGTGSLHRIETEVSRISIGDAEFLTIPGEALPNIGFYLKHMMTGKHKFLLGLCGDELGYILTPEDYYLDLYRYESSVSVGSEIGTAVVSSSKELVAEAAKVSAVRTK